jgi:hypothetical protein
LSGAGPLSAALLLAVPLGGAAVGALLGHLSWGGVLEEWTMAERARRVIAERHREWVDGDPRQRVAAWAQRADEEAFWQEEVLRVQSAVPPMAEGKRASSGAAPQLSFESRSGWREELSTSTLDSRYLALVLIAAMPALLFEAYLEETRSVRKRRAASPLHSFTEVE